MKEFLNSSPSTLYGELDKLLNSEKTGQFSNPWPYDFDLDEGAFSPTCCRISVVKEKQKCVMIYYTSVK